MSLERGRKGFGGKIKLLYFSLTKGKISTYSNRCASISNDDEISIILDYLRVLIFQNKVDVDDIVLLTFYQKQCAAVKAAILRLDLEEEERIFFTNLLITSPRASQGIEKGVSILSLVQADRPKLGEFLRCPDQNLVALSRAYSLLIVIGDQDLISQEPVWKAITNYRIPIELKGRAFLKLNQAWSKKYLTRK